MKSKPLVVLSFFLYSFSVLNYQKALKNQWFDKIFNHPFKYPLLTLFVLSPSKSIFVLVFVHVCIHLSDYRYIFHGSSCLTLSRFLPDKMRLSIVRGSRTPVTQFYCTAGMNLEEMRKNKLHV